LKPRIFSGLTAHSARDSAGLRVGVGHTRAQARLTRTREGYRPPGLRLELAKLTRRAGRPKYEQYTGGWCQAPCRTRNMSAPAPPEAAGSESGWHVSNSAALRPGAGGLGSESRPRAAGPGHAAAGTAACHAGSESIRRVGESVSCWRTCRLTRHQTALIRVPRWVLIPGIVEPPENLTCAAAAAAGPGNGKSQNGEYNTKDFHFSSIRLRVVFAASEFH
jgi:hypothetical protein